MTEELTEESFDRKIAHTLKGDLDKRSRIWAEKLKMEPRDFVYRIVEGFIQALESDDVAYEIPFLNLCRIFLKKPTVSSNLVFSLLSIASPNLPALRDEARAEHNRYLVGLLNLNDAPLTPELLAKLQKQADDMNQMRIAREKEMEKAKESQRRIQVAALFVASNLHSTNTMNETKNDLPISEKAVLKPEEFAALFGRQKVWAYRQIYAGKVMVLTHLGRIMIPKSEVARLLEAQHVYNGPEKETFKEAVRASRVSKCPKNVERSQSMMEK